MSFFYVYSYVLAIVQHFCSRRKHCCSIRLWTMLKEIGSGGDRDAFWLAALTLARYERMDDAHQNWFAVCVEAMLKSYSVTYSGPQCHEENWEPEEDGVCPICLKKLSEKPPSPGPWYIL
uniref:Uncharacterized protein n=1 Tax=Trichogramma kaykai TaxID=54128 RepID=A0ABD2XP25_9HYME